MPGYLINELSGHSIRASVNSVGYTLLCIHVILALLGAFLLFLLILCVRIDNYDQS